MKLRRGGWPSVLVDLVVDSSRSLRSRLVRTFGIGAAVTLGVATYVALATVAGSADANVQERLAGLQPRMINVSPEGSTDTVPAVDEPARHRIEALPGVVAATAIQIYADVPVAARPPTSPDREARAQVDVVTGDFFRATGTTTTRGATSSDSLPEGTTIAFVGRSLAEDIGLGADDLGQAVWIGGRPYGLGGIVLDSATYPPAISGVVLVGRTSRPVLDPRVPAAIDVHVRTTLGAAPELAPLVPLAIDPAHPYRWRASVPSAASDVAEGISEDLQRLTLAMAGIILLIGVVSIGNALMRSVYERTPEIGLRRALGARHVEVLGLLILEAAVIGLLAGAIGVALGATAGVILVEWNDWPLRLPVVVLLLAAPASALAGMAGGLVPALSALRITPSRALRRN